MKPITFKRHTCFTKPYGKETTLRKLWSKKGKIIHPFSFQVYTYKFLEFCSPNLAIKKLRYYARFIVVCLLLSKKDTSRLLMEELQGLVKDYQVTYKPSDAQEWEQVLQEISTFLDADKSILPVDYEGLTVQVNSRIKFDSSFKSKEGSVKIQEAIVCGNNSSQVCKIAMLNYFIDLLCGVD